jgi:hypothetical protein
MAGPALMEPPRTITTRMIANSSTTDSEMATTDHTLGRSRSTGPGRRPWRAPARTIVPPTGRSYAARETSSCTRARRGAPATGAYPACVPLNTHVSHVNSSGRPCGNSHGSFPCPHISFAGDLNYAGAWRRRRGKCAGTERAQRASFADRTILVCPFRTLSSSLIVWNQDTTPAYDMAIDDGPTYDSPARDVVRNT